MSIMCMLSVSVALLGQGRNNLRIPVFDREKVAKLASAFHVPGAVRPSQYQARTLSTGTIQVTVSDFAQFQLTSGGEVVDYVDYATKPLESSSRQVPAAMGTKAALDSLNRILAIPPSFEQSQMVVKSGSACEVRFLAKEPMPYKAYDYYNFVSYVYRADLKRPISFHRESRVVIDSLPLLSGRRQPAKRSGFRYVGLGLASPMEKAEDGKRHVRLCDVYEFSGRRMFFDAQSGIQIKSTDLPSLR